MARRNSRDASSELVQADMINDWKDAERDAENTTGMRPFTGGSRVIQLGLISRADMGFFGLLLFVIATLIGIYLVFISGWKLIPLIIYGIIAGLFYTNEKERQANIGCASG